jgi:transposase
MGDGLRLNSKETQRARVITAVLAGQVTVAQAEVVLGMSERSVYRLLRAMKEAGPESLAHGNRGSTSGRRIGEETVERVVALASSTYRGVNTSHLADLLEEREGITIGRSTLQRILAARGLTTGKPQRRPRHRSRRERRARASRSCAPC